MSLMVKEILHLQISIAHTCVCLLAMGWRLRLFRLKALRWFLNGMRKLNPYINDFYVSINIMLLNL